MQLIIFELLFKYMTTKEEFLVEHNNLAPDNLQATMEVLSTFKKEKPNFFKGDDNDWSIAKIRRPFILWLTSQ